MTLRRLATDKCLLLEDWYSVLTRFSRRSGQKVLSVESKGILSGQAEYRKQCKNQKTPHTIQAQQNSFHVQIMFQKRVLRMEAVSLPFCMWY